MGFGDQKNGPEEEIQALVSGAPRCGLPRPLQAGRLSRTRAYALGSSKRLKRGVVLSVFPFKQNVSSNREERLRKRTSERAEEIQEDFDPLLVGADIEIASDVTPSSSNTTTCSAEVQCSFLTDGTRVENYADNPKAMKYLTGFESFEHFNMFFNMLGPAVSQLDYSSKSLDPRNERFLCLIKLRQAKDDYGLALDFKISQKTVGNVFKTWLRFLFYELKDLELWPSRELINHHFPKHFKKMFPSTRVILDATEVPIERSSNCNVQRATWSSYKNTNTLKTMIGVTPRGCVSYVSDSYGGSISDRQIIETGPLITTPNMFEKGDSILADRGIMVQDCFANKDVKVNTPMPLKGINQFEAATVVRDRRIASKRIHVERVIGYAKTYKILKRKLPISYMHLGSMIVYVVFMLINYRPSIVSRNA